MESSLQRGQQRWSKVYSDIPLTNRSLNPQPEKLKDSKFNTPEDLAEFFQRFDEGVKKVFSTSNNCKDQYIRFCSRRDNDLKYGIKAGKLTLTG